MLLAVLPAVVVLQVEDGSRRVFPEVKLLLGEIVAPHLRPFYGVRKLRPILVVKQRLSRSVKGKRKPGYGVGADLALPSRYGLAFLVDARRYPGPAALEIGVNRCLKILRRTELERAASFSHRI
jgi:hypothetical protein